MHHRGYLCGDELVSGLLDATGTPLTPSASVGTSRPLIVRDASDTPVPPSEVLAGLHRIHPSLGLRYRGMEWCITWEWPETDRRWQWVRESKQDAASAYDTVGRLPLDCPLEQAPGYIENALKSYPIEEIRSLANRITNYNRIELPKAQVAEAMADTFDAMGQHVGKSEGFSAGGLPKKKSVLNGQHKKGKAK